MRNPRQGRPGLDQLLELLPLQLQAADVRVMNKKLQEGSGLARFLRKRALPEFYVLHLAI